MRRSAPSLIAVAVALTLAALAGCRRSPEAVQLGYRFAVGTEYRYRFTSAWTGRVEAAGQAPRTFTRREISDIRRTVEAFDPASRVATLREVSTARADESRIDATRRHAWSGSVLLRLRTDGSFVALEQADRQEGFLGQGYLEQLYSQSLPVFPAGPVLPGHAWTQTKRVPLPDGKSTDAEARFVYEGVQLVGDRRCAVVSQSNHVVIPFFDEGARGQDESTGRGRLYIGLAEGVLVREEIEREVLPKRWYAFGMRQLPTPGRTQYHAVERLELISISPHRP